MERELVRGVMILNEIHVQIARNMANNTLFETISEQINEVRSIMLDEAFPGPSVDMDYVQPGHTIMPEIVWDDILNIRKASQEKNDGC